MWLKKSVWKTVSIVQTGPPVSHVINTPQYPFTPTSSQSVWKEEKPTKRLKSESAQHSQIILL